MNKTKGVTVNAVDVHNGYICDIVSKAAFFWDLKFIFDERNFLQLQPYLYVQFYHVKKYKA